jgi:hypothetical protein
MKCIRPLVVAGLVFGCGKHEQPTLPKASPKQPSEVRPQPKTASRSLTEFVSAVRDIDQSPDDLSHQRIVIALHELADLFDELPANGAASSIRTTAAELESAGTGSLDHADLVERALREAQRALEEHSDQPPGPLLAALSLLSSAIDDVRGDRPLLEQHRNVVTALQAIGNALAIVRDETEQFAVASPQPDRSPDTALANARSRTLELARTDWMNAHLVAAKLLEDLAASATQQGASNIDRLRFEARRLRAPDPTFDRLDRIKRALGLAVTSLGLPDSESTDARAAIANIDVRSSLAFQRPAVQDAVRATVQLFIAARRECAGPRTARSP